jgi:uncharacterized protein YndB with AHSA1/START domain
MAKIIHIEAEIAASKQKAWDFYTQPAHIVNWNFAHESWQCPNATNDLQIGGKYTARMEAKDGSFGFDFEAVYEDIIDGEEFTYTIADGRQVNVRFDESDKGTLVSIAFEPEKMNPEAMQQAGWQAILDNFKQYTEAH